jgi:hypothetical protein
VKTVKLPNADVEALLTREARARLPFGRQIILYLDPFALFKDASQGSASMRESALCYNRSKRWMLLAYIRRWLLIAACSFLAIAPTEALAADAPFLKITAAGFGIACSVAFVVAACAAVSYFVLGRSSRS